SVDALERRGQRLGEVELRSCGHHRRGRRELTSGLVEVGDLVPVRQLAPQSLALSRLPQALAQPGTTYILILHVRMTAVLALAVLILAVRLLTVLALSVLVLVVLPLVVRLLPVLALPVLILAVPVLAVSRGLAGAAVGMTVSVAVAVAAVVGTALVVGH